jgi:hypothetical protein
VQLKSIHAFADLEARKLAHANLHPELEPRVATHREQQLHQPPRSYVVIADPVIAYDSQSDQPVVASLSAMHHGMFTLQVNCPPAILNCPLCAPRTIRHDLSIIGRPPVSRSTSTLSACHLTPPILSIH